MDVAMVIELISYVIIAEIELEMQRGVVIYQGPTKRSQQFIKLSISHFTTINLLSLIVR